MSTTSNVSKIKKSLRISIIEGVISSAAMGGLTQNYIIPFALQLQATTFQIGLLTSVPNILMAFSQLLTPNLVERIGSRKGVIIPAVFIETIMWLPILLIPFLFQGNSFLYLLTFITFKTIAGGLAGPAWGSMMADLAAEGVRGRYFSRRNMLNNAAGLGIGFVAMLIMQHYQDIDQQFIGFCWLFGGALVLRLAAVFLFTRMYEPPMWKSPQSSVSVLTTIRSLKNSNLGKFIIVMALTMFTMNIAGPFVSVYLLRDLNFDYISYIIILGAGGVFSILFQPFWGRRADKSGNVIIVKIVTILMPLVPISFIFSANLYYLIAIQALNAFLITGLNLAAMNFIFDATKQGERTQHLAVFNLFTGLATCGGALLGGVLAANLPPLFGYSIKTLFLVAGLTRLLVVALGFRQIKEVRDVPKINLVNFFLGRFPKTGIAGLSRRGFRFDLMPDFKDEEFIDKDNPK